MIKNYFKIAFRNLIRQKAYSFVNIAGLAAGIACFMLIFLYVSEELSYDRFHSKADRTYRLIEIINMEGQGEESSSAPLPTAQALLTDYPQYIEKTVRIFNFQVPFFTLTVGDKKFNEKKLFFADSTFFEVFDYPLAYGDKDKVLSEPNSIILTKELAKKYFGEENAVGREITWEGNFNLKITGILEDSKHNSHFDFDGLISYHTINAFTGPQFGTNWIWNPAWTYLLLKPGVNPEALEREFPAFIDKYYPEVVKSQIVHWLQPLTDIHLHSDLDYEITKNGSITTVYIFAVVGILILLIACINFMNLATARSAKRAREVGMRKVLGADRTKLIYQFIGESVILSFIAVFFAVIIIQLFLPAFNSMAGKELSFNLLGDPYLIIVLTLVALLTGIFSGTYPAFFLSSTVPIKVLKGKYEPGSRSAFLRKILVVAQFAISLTLIIGTIVIYQQLSYMQNAELGFNKDQVVVVATRPSMLQQAEALKNEFKSHPEVLSVTRMNEILGEHHNTHDFHYEGMQPDKFVYLPALMVDEDFVPTFDLQIIAGRNFSKEFKREDSLSIIINEAMVRKAGWNSPEEAIGKIFYSNQGRERVIGVVKDFNYVSLKEPIGPFVLDIFPGLFFVKYLAVKVKGENLKSTIDHLEAKWAQIAPAFPFEYFFLDEDLDKLYKDQDNLFRLIGYFSILAIFIACLGMFALSSFTAEQKTKEIGIRKVLGASTPGIVTLLSKDFLKLVLIANLIAWPAAYFALNRWLDDFAFRIDIPVWSFILASVIAFIIAFITISYQSVKAALANPVSSLKYE